MRRFDLYRRGDGSDSLEAVEAVKRGFSRVDRIDAYSTRGAIDTWRAFSLPVV